jgi:hypothetical protein
MRSYEYERRRTSPPLVEVIMRSIVSLASILVVALIAALIYKFYFTQGQQAGAIAHPQQTFDVIGVKSDLMAIGQAERIYQTDHNSYGSLDELVSSGAMTLPKTGRDGYTYEAEASTDTFRVLARCPAATAPGCTNYAIDQTLEIQTSP